MSTKKPVGADVPETTDETAPDAGSEAPVVFTEASITRPRTGPLATPVVRFVPPTDPALADGSAAAEEPRKARSGHVFLTYRGDADVLSFNEYNFRPGIPVETPKDIAEELLTLPFEKFDVQETSDGSRRNEGSHRAG